MLWCHSSRGIRRKPAESDDVFMKAGLGLHGFLGIVTAPGQPCQSPTRRRDGMDLEKGTRKKSPIQVSGFLRSSAEATRPQPTTQNSFKTVETLLYTFRPYMQSL